VAIAAAALLAGAIAAGALWMLNERAAERSAAVQSKGEALVGGPFSLVDHNGRRRSDADFRGRYMLVFFGFTHCPDVCPTTLALITEALKKLGPRAEEIVPIFVSVDPARDTPEAMKQYLKSFDPRFVGLTGTEDDVAKTANAYRVFVNKHAHESGGYAVDHSSVIYLMDKGGRFLANYALEQGPDAIAEDLKKRI
jgi:protein SCO1/2